MQRAIRCIKLGSSITSNNMSDCDPVSIINASTAAFIAVLAALGYGAIRQQAQTDGPRPPWHRQAQAYTGQEGNPGGQVQVQAQGDAEGDGEEGSSPR